MVAKWGCGGDIERAKALPLSIYNRYLFYATCEAEAEPIQLENAQAESDAKAEADRLKAKR